MKNLSMSSFFNNSTALNEISGISSKIPNALTLLLKTILLLVLGQ